MLLRGRVRRELPLWDGRPIGCGGRPCARQLRHLQLLHLWVVLRQQLLLLHRHVLLRGRLCHLHLLLLQLLL